MRLPEFCSVPHLYVSRPAAAVAHDDAFLSVPEMGPSY